MIKSDFLSKFVFNPLGAMLSHDNVTWTSRVCMEGYNWDKEVLLSYLPLSHVAGHMIDCYMNMVSGGKTGFADKDALRGTLVIIIYRKPFCCLHINHP